MGYRNKPLYLCVKQDNDRWELYLSTEHIKYDFRHSSPILREILFEFLQGRYIAPSYKDHLYLESFSDICVDTGHLRNGIWLGESRNLYDRVCKVSDNPLCSEYFLDSWCNYWQTDVFECNSPDECTDKTNICTLYTSVFEPHDSTGTYTDPCFLYCISDSEKCIRELEKIIKRVIKKADRELMCDTEHKPDRYYEGEEAFCCVEINDQYGLNCIDKEYYSKLPRFDTYPLYFFPDEKGMSLATSPDCQYAALNRLLDRAIYTALSEKFDLSIELDMVSERIFEHVVDTDKCYRDTNRLVVLKMDDCMFCDFFRTYTIDTLFYKKGEYTETKDKPKFKLSFSPMGLNANLIASFEIYDDSVRDDLKEVMSNIASAYRRTLHLDTTPPLTKLPETVCNVPHEQLDILLNGIWKPYTEEQKRLVKEHKRIMKLRNGETLPPTFKEKVSRFFARKEN